jgi:hypothetical protein
VLGLAKNAAADSHDRIGSEYVGVRNVAIVGNLVAGRFGLCFGETCDERARHLRALGRLIDRCWPVGVGLDADLGEESHAARAGARQDELGPCIIRFGARSRLGELPAERIAARPVGPRQRCEKPGFGCRHHSTLVWTLHFKSLR